MSRRPRQDLQAAAQQAQGRPAGDRRRSEPHRVSQPTIWRQLRLRTNDKITHAAWPELRTRDENDAFTLCGLRLHHCDLSRCRHPDRHRTRAFSVRRSHDELVDCMTCLHRQAKQEST